MEARHRKKNWYRYLQHIWSRLTEPQYETASLEERHRARLITSLILVLTPLSIPVAIVGTYPDHNTLALPAFYIIMIGTFLGIVMYFVSRTPYFKYGYAILIGVLSIIVFIVHIVDEPSENDLIVLVYLAFPIIVSSALMKARTILWVSAMQIGGVLVVGLVRPETYSHNMMLDLMGFLFMVTVAVVLITRDRNRLEYERNAQLKMSEERHRQTVERSPNAIFTLDRAGIIQSWNQGCVNLFGYDTNIIGQSVEILLANPQDMAEFDDMLQRAWAGETFTGVQIRYRNSTNQQRLTLSRFIPLFDTNGDVDAIFVGNTDLTDIHISQQALRRSEEEFRSIFEMSPIGMAIISPDRYFVRVNQAFCDMIGYTPSELQEMTILDITIPDDVERTKDIHEQTLRGELSGAHREKIYIRKDGTHLPALLKFTTSYKANGEVDHYIAQIVDITDRKRAEDALQQANAELENRVQERTAELLAANAALKEQIAERERAEAALSRSEAYLRKIFDHSNDAIFVIDVQADCIYDANPQAAAMLGYSREELTQCCVSDIHPDELPLMNELADVVIEKGYGWTDELTCRRKDGIKIPAEISASSFEHNSKPAMLCLVRDVSQRREAERALREERNLLRTILDNAADFIFVKDRQGRFVLMNQAGLERIGAREDDLIGQTADAYYDAEKAAAFNKTDRIVLETGQALLNQEVHTIREDGSERWTSTNKVPLRNADGDIIGIVGIARDITELKLIQQDLQRANDALEQRVAERTAELTATNEQLQHEIAEREQAQESLRANEERLRSIFEQSKDGIFIIDPANDRIIEANPMASQMLRYTPEALLQTPVSRIHPNDTTHLQEFVHIVMQAGHAWTDELACVTSDGELIEVEVSASLLVLDGQSFILAIVRDLTERRQAQRALRESQQLYQSLVSSVDGIVWEAEADTLAFTFVSPQAERLLGYPVSEWLDNPNFWVEHIYEADREWIVDLCKREAAAGRSHEFQYRMVSATGEIVWLHDVVSVVTENGKPSKLRGLMVDISEQKRVEQERERDAQRLAYMLGIHRALLGTQSVEEIAQNALDQTYLFIPYSRGTVVTFDFEKQEGTLLAIKQQSATTRLNVGQSIPFHLWLIEHLQAGKHYIIDNNDDESLDETAKILKREGLKTFLVIPLIAQGKLIGTFNLGSQEADAFEEEIVALLHEIADPLAIAIQQTNLVHQLEQQAIALRKKTESLEMLNAVADAIHGSLDISTVTMTALEAVAEYTQADALGIFVPDEDPQLVRRVATFGMVDEIINFGGTLPMHGSVAGMVIRENRTVIIEDLTTHPDAHQASQHPLARAGFKSGIVLPLPYQDHAVGAMTLLFKTHDQLTEEQLDTLRAIGQTIGMALSNAQYVSDIDTARAHEYEQRILAEALQQTAAVLSSTLHLEEVLDRILEQVALVIPHDQSSIMLMGAENGAGTTIRYRRYDTAENIFDVEKATFDVTNFKTLQYMIKTKQPCVISDVTNSDLWTYIAESDWMRSYVGAPILIGEEIVGFIHLDSATQNHFDDHDADVLKAFANQASIALQNARLYEQIQDYTTLLEESVDQRFRELRIERNRLDAILNSTAEGIFYTEGMHIQFVNKALTEITGYSSDEILQQPVTVFQPDDATDDEVEMMQNIINGDIGGAAWRGEMRLRRKDGSTFISGQTVSLVAPGEPIRAVTIVRDISKAKELQEQKERFITYAAHELRTPITNLKTRVYLMKNQPERLEHHVQVVDRVVNHMGNLVENMLDLSRFERGVIILNRAKIDLKDVLCNVIVQQEAEAGLKHITLMMEAADRQFYVDGDAKWLQQVFTNLIVNAINYTQEGGHICVRLKHHRAEDRLVDQVVVEIEDDGIGISKAHQEQIFESFFRVGIGDGTGLGLSITREIINLHNGDITVESTLGEGSRFRVFLDLLPE